MFAVDVSEAYYQIKVSTPWTRRWFDFQALSERVPLFIPSSDSETDSDDSSSTETSWEDLTADSSEPPIVDCDQAQFRFLGHATDPEPTRHRMPALVGFEDEKEAEGNMPTVTFYWNSDSDDTSDNCPEFPTIGVNCPPATRSASINNRRSWEARMLGSETVDPEMSILVLDHTNESIMGTDSYNTEFQEIRRSSQSYC